MLRKEAKRRVGAFMLALILILTLANGSYVQASHTQELTVDTVMESVKNYMLSVDTNPGYGSIWNIIGLSRSGLDVPQAYYDTFYSNIVQYMKEKNFVLTKNKYSEYSKIIVALSAIGKDARMIEGTNLLYYLSDFNNVTKQGFNGPVWALIALKSHPAYRIPENPDAVMQTTEEGLVSYILSKETSQGGWTLYGDVPDSDITGMTIQALSSYYGKREDVTAAIDRAVNWLSASQCASGGYQTMNTETSESIAQVVTALSGIGIDADTDTRFVKNGKSAMDALFAYYLPEGGFMHVAAGSGNNGGGEGGKLNGMATEQGFYTCVAYKRMQQGKTFLYDMSDCFTVDAWEDAPEQDISKKPEQSPEQGTTQPSEAETTTAPENDTKEETAKVKVICISLDYGKINIKEGQSKTLAAEVTPSNATNKKIKWKSSDKKIATVTQKGKVTGKKAGTVTITAAAKDGSGIKAECTVVVLGGQAATNQTKKTTTKKITLKKSTDKKEAKEKKEEQAAESDTTKWAFDTEQYVPESSSDEESSGDSFHEANAAEHTLPPVAYLGIGIAIGIGGCALLWTLWRAKKRK